MKASWVWKVWGRDFERKQEKWIKEKGKEREIQKWKARGLFEKGLVNKKEKRRYGSLKGNKREDEQYT